MKVCLIVIWMNKSGPKASCYCAQVGSQRTVKAHFWQEDWKNNSKNKKNITEKDRKEK